MKGIKKGNYVTIPALQKAVKSKRSEARKTALGIVALNRDGVITDAEMEASVGVLLCRTIRGDIGERIAKRARKGHDRWMRMRGERFR